MEQNTGATIDSTKSNNPTQNTNIQTANLQVQQPQGQKPTETKPIDYRLSENPNKTLISTEFSCSIRRKNSPEMQGIPGEAWDARNYSIGSCIDIQTRKSLKGVNGKVEEIIMPQIVATSANAYEFMQKIDEYWANIGVLIPADDVNLEEEDKGKVLTIRFRVAFEILRNKFNEQPSIEAKINYLTLLIERGEALLDYESLSDYLLLCYCLKYPRVAKNISDVNKSGKIRFYLYEKSTALVARMSELEIEFKASRLFSTIQEDDDKLNAVLLEFKEDYTKYKTTLEKVLKVNELYKPTVVTQNMLIKIVEDTNWETRYLVLASKKAGKLKNPENSTLYYYNEKLIGSNLDEAILFLLSDSVENVQIRKTLEREIGFVQKQVN
jgi:hypothetical protein